MMFAKMQCEMCGADVKGPLKRIKIEGAELSVCNACAKYGVEIQPVVPRTAAGQPVKVFDQSGMRTGQVVKSRDMFDQMGGDLVEDYAERIREARSKLGMTQKDLALAMMERELLVKKIEKGELIPEEDVRKKLEKVLDIHLIESSESERASLQHTRMNTTMGDVISIKKSKR
jgi:putative transcription factor